MATMSDMQSAIDNADAAHCADLIRGLDEKSRRTLYPSIAERIDNQCHGKSQEVARLALLGTATLGELKKAGPWWPYPESEQFAQHILSDRRPPWLADWADATLTENFRAWPLVRRLVREGVLRKPQTEFYTLGMIHAPRNLTARQLLEQDPDLIADQLWCLFECEGSGELSLAAYDKYVQQDMSWAEAFRSMASDGTIDRTRVLEATLEALQRDFAPFRAGWFSRLHAALTPSREERAGLRARYLDLVASRVPATVSFAMKALVELHKAGSLNPMAELEQLAPAFEASDKGTVRRALSLSAKAMKACDDAGKRRLASVVARALGHGSAEIQRLATEQLDGHRAATEPYLEALAPSVRASLGERVAAEAAVPTPLARRVSAARVRPISDLCELIETFAVVLENQGPPMEIERVIDGVARLGIAGVADEKAFGRLTAALAKRAEKLLKNLALPQPRTALARLALAWIRAERFPVPESDQDLSEFLIWRLWQATEQAAQRIAQPLLSFPTETDGRIERVEFDRRMRELDAQQQQSAADPDSIFHLDFLLARLRAGADERERPTLRLQWKRRNWWTPEGKTVYHHKPSLDVANLDAPGRFAPEGLTFRPIRSSVEMKRWCSTVDPHAMERWFAAGCVELGDNIDWWEADWSTRAYLEPLLHPGVPIGPMGALLIALGLAAKEAGQSGLAVDALIMAGGDGRLDPGWLGTALREAEASGAIKFARWAKQLGQAAQAGAALARLIFEALEILFESGQGKTSNDFGRLLETAVEAGHLAGSRLTRQGAVRTISDLQGKGKAGRAAQALLALWRDAIESGSQSLRR